MNLNIRLVCPEEMVQVLHLQRQAIQMLCRKDYSPHQVDAIVQSQHQWRGQQERIYVAQKGEHLVGFIAFSPCTTKILGIYVHPNHIRQGIATQLLQYFEQLAIRKQRQTLQVIASLTAVALYQSQGYVCVKKTEINALGISVPCLIMEKSTNVFSSTYGFDLAPEILWALICIFLLLLLFL